MRPRYNRRMLRVLLVFALFWPLCAGAKSKKRAHDQVEIWPPPAPGTDQAGQPVEEPKPKPEPPPDAGDPYALDPELLQGPRSPRAAPTSAEPIEDACADAYASCSEDCIVVHATDDTLHVKPGAKLPIAVCEGRCKQRLRICKEQKRVGIDQNDPHRREDEDDLRNH